MKKFLCAILIMATLQSYASAISLDTIDGIGLDTLFVEICGNDKLKNYSNYS